MAKKKKEKCLIIEYKSLPKKNKEILKEDYRFRNDILLEYQSEFYTPGYEKIPWSKYLTTKELQRIYQEQVKDNDFQGNFNDFIKEYGMEMDLWFVGEIKKKNINLKGVEKILIDISW